jgi:hypothetical protein
MADNYTFTAGTSGTAASDDVGGIQYPRMKIALGNDGTADGDVYSGRPLPAAVISGTVDKVSGGTIDMFKAGTINAGSIAVTAGTGIVTGGSIVVTAGTIAAGSIAVVAGTGVVTSGSVAVVAGTGVVTGGSIAVTAGTITAGSVAVVAGTGVLTSGSVAVVAGTGVLTSGSVAIVAGTINAGTINSGTINAGTINAGTFRMDARSTQNILSYSTTQVFSASAFATLVGSTGVGAGTSIWVNDVSIVNHNGTVQAGVMFGSAINGTSVIAKGMFGPQGGIQKSFSKAVNCGMTNYDLNCWSDAAGTVTFSVSYFISA